MTVFFVLVIVFSAVFEALICLGGSDRLYLALMWAPGLAALVGSCIALREEGTAFSLKALLAKGGFHRCRLRDLLLGCLLPLIYLLIPYAVYWLLHPEAFAYRGVSPVLVLRDLLPVMLLGTLFSLPSALGEETGWRGFMVPALFRRMGLNRTLVLSSLIWCVWHLPLLVCGDYMPGTPLWYQLPAFVLCIFPVGVMAGLLALESGSLWPAAFLHAAHNNYDQMVFSVITAGADRMYFVSETGILTIVCAWALAAVMYLRHIKRSCQTNTEQSMKQLFEE